MDLYWGRGNRTFGVNLHGKYDYPNPAMAIAKLVGFDLPPRLRDLAERKLFLPRGIDAPAGLEQVLMRDVSPASIRKAWDGLRWGPRFKAVGSAPMWPCSGSAAPPKAIRCIARRTSWAA